MIDYNFEEACCGCTACSNICPVNAISISKDVNGFAFPQIDKKKCIDCGACDRVCPHLVGEKSSAESVDDVATWLYASADSDAKLRSASGGAFYELAKSMLAAGGYVVGCVWNEHLVAQHIVSNKYDDLMRMQGSKYVQSDMSGTYKQVYKLLVEGKKVLFSGTPCQAEAVHQFVMAKGKKYRENLVTVGVICHGVAAPEVWESHKRWLEAKHGAALTDVNFRDKSQEGYKKCYCKYTYSDGVSTYIPTYLPSSKYIESTLVYNLAIRKSCGHCDCKGIRESCDLILGDWYAEYDRDGALGTSCMVACTARGKAYAKNNLQGLRPFSLENVIRDNNYIVNSVAINKRRDEFLTNFNDEIWDDVERFYPLKYKYKKLLVKIGVFEFLKRHVLK